jgi:hypothetical protein
LHKRESWTPSSHTVLQKFRHRDACCTRGSPELPLQTLSYPNLNFEIPDAQEGVPDSLTTYCIIKNVSYRCLMHKRESQTLSLHIVLQKFHHREACCMRGSPGLPDDIVCYQKCVIKMPMHKRESRTPSSHIALSELELRDSCCTRGCPGLPLHN